MEHNFPALLCFIAIISLCGLETSKAGDFCKTTIKDGNIVSSGNCVPQERNPVIQALDKKLAEREDVQAPKGERITDPVKINSFVQGCAMGMKSRKIGDDRIYATSDVTPSFHGKFARLDETCRDVYVIGKSYGCWLPTDYRSGNSYLQIDLGTPQLIEGVVTQGRPKHYNVYVEFFSISCGSDLANMRMIEENGAQKVFTGNFDQNSKVLNVFPEKLTCRYIRFHVVFNKVQPALRMELISPGC